MKKLLIIALLTLVSFSANALVTKSVDNQGTIWYYSSFPMPGAKWKTKIAVKRIYEGQFTVAVPFYYYGNNINSDIIKLRDYMQKNYIQFKDGVCTTFPYTTPCLY